AGCRGLCCAAGRWLRAGLSRSVWRFLTGADAFHALGLSRRDAIWAVSALIGTYGADTLPLFKAGEAGPVSRDDESGLPPMLPGEEVIHDYQALSLSLKGHPMSFLRAEMTRRRIVAADELRTLQPGRMVTVAGLVLVRQR